MERSNTARSTNAGSGSEIQRPNYTQPDPMPLKLSRCEKGVSATELIPWEPTFSSLVKEISQSIIGIKDGAYFIRCLGTQRTNADTTDIANIIILDGDSRLDENGEIFSGAPDPEKVHEALTELGVTHVIYSSHSNGASEAELFSKRIDSGGVYGKDYYKCQSTSKNLHLSPSKIFQVET